MRFFLICSLVFLNLSCANKSGRELASRPQSVLYIGDSQSAGPLGAVVYEHLQKSFQEENINLYAVGGSSPRHWGSAGASERNGKYKNWLCSAKRKGRVGLNSRVPTQGGVCAGPSRESIFSYLNRDKPDLVIFQFLGNSMKMSRARIVNRIDNLLNHLEPHQKCLWITSPPYFRDDDGKFTKRNRVRSVTEDSFVQAIGDRCDVFRGMKGQNWERFAKSYEYYYSKRDNGSRRGDGMHFNSRGAQAFYESFKHKLP